MSATVLDAGPHGRGYSHGSRAELAITTAKRTARITTKWKPQPFQRKVLACERGIVFAIGGIGSGKSEAAALRLLMWALRNPRRADGNPTTWFVIGPEFSLIRKEQFSKILAHCRRLKELGYGAIVKRVVYGQHPKIVLRDGQVLLGIGGDHYKRMEGHEAEGFWQDEAQRQPKQAFTTALSRLRSADTIRGVISASPEDSPGWLWKAIDGKDPKVNKLRAKLAAVGAGVRIFRVASRENTANKGDVLDVISAAFEADDENLVEQKIRGRFPGTPEAPSLGTLDFGRAFVERVTLSPDAGRVEVLAVDIGETKDFTWFAGVSKRCVTLYQERFNAGSPGVPRETFYPYTEDRIIATAQRLGASAIVIDIGKAGKPIAQNIARRLANTKTRVISYDTSAPGKKADAIGGLALAMSRGDWTVPEVWVDSKGVEHKVAHVAQLAKEFQELVRSETPKGKPAYDHPPGGHDDGVTAHALAHHVLTTQKPSGGGASASWDAPNLGDSMFGGSGGGYMFGPR